ncbi:MULTISPECIES: cysteine desulfurase NifS [Methanothrix]|jgi:cysteine desulfurase|uniref:Cysteine desulfurase IscS n=1 Tax=Methanothrix soehngenii (strain ATCC 5969 / DSM 3671 / JCM 10134 / NBRC 103675 / OCM 69 / GP-6) TaxID=990316 RepID=F4BVS6_METSG|nr:MULTISPECIES: cysteine desulfurase NifS [Methanothrix]AEB69689.1 cysteine desulfurase NifS [Methanothrix soehngenii GP6]HNQ53495.1 cysteine desulfurase NifS [Methanothrix soehngenii]HPY92436.1 cysteine desulfurase NifS [Methanothrix soehngenii]
MKRIYMDHSATTPVAPEVLAAMLPYFGEKFGNASSLHRSGREAKEALEDSREKVAALLGARAEEIIFTSGGTESDNLALKGIARKNRKLGKHIITTQIEHPAILETCRALEKEGFEVTYLPVTGEGLVELSTLEASIRPDTILISVMHANNEVGTIQPLEEIGRLAAERDIYLHSDAVQSVGKIPVNVDDLGVDLLSLSAHKLYGPKGVGALYIRKGTKLESIIQGGGHERRLRSGTENISGIVGLARAAELAERDMPREAERLAGLRDRLAELVLGKVKDAWINGTMKKRLPGNLNFGFKYVEGESLLLFLDSKGICVSTGSACSSHKLEPSHVLMSLGLKAEECHGSLRITLGMSNTLDEVEYVAESIVEAVERFRGISALGR